MPLAKTAKTTLLYNHYEIILNGMKWKWLNRWCQAKS
jgi:hypothetical protein